MSYETRKAYTVTEDDEGHAVIVFARNGAEARRRGASKLDMSFEEVSSCRRSPAWDSYAEAGKVPPLDLIAGGWWYECQCCGSRIDSDHVNDDGDEIEPVGDGDHVYCDTGCMMALWRTRRDRQAREAAAVEACATHFYGMPITNLRGGERMAEGGRDTVLICEFDFPGRTGMMAEWRMGEPHIYVSECDRGVWLALKASSAAKAPA